jgi:hypothetical protein
MVLTVSCASSWRCSQSMDIRRGIPRPATDRGRGAKWHRRSVRELFGFAFGKPIPWRSQLRRIERWLRALTSMKVMTTTQMRVKTAGGFESKTAIRHVTDQLFKLAGTFGQLAKRAPSVGRLRSVRRCRQRVESVYVDQAKTANAGAYGRSRPVEAGLTRSSRQRRPLTAVRALCWPHLSKIGATSRSHPMRAIVKNGAQPPAIGR